MVNPNLLWHSNSPLASTGYGQQTALFCERLKDTYNIGISAFYGVEGAPIGWNGIPVYPGLAQTHGNETIQQHARVHFGDDLREIAQFFRVTTDEILMWNRISADCKLQRGMFLQLYVPPEADLSQHASALNRVLRDWNEQAGA